jgi:hypothetical protein
MYESADESTRTRQKNRRTVEMFLSPPEGVEPWWVPTSPVLAALADDFTMEIPWSPRGMPKVMTGQTLKDFMEFLSKSIKTYAYRIKCLYDTGNPCMFVTEDEGQGEVTWCGGGIYRNRHVGIIKLNESGRICLHREYFNPQYHFPEHLVEASRADTFNYNEERARVGLKPVHIHPDELNRMPSLT